MKIGIIVLCRYNSSRLPGKILLKISGKTILQHIIDRLLCVKGGYPICVATSSEIDDKPIIDYCKGNNINFFDGSKKNVASRFLNCAKANDFDFATRINGDNLFTDPLIIEDMIDIAKNRHCTLKRIVERFGRLFQTSSSFIKPTYEVNIDFDESSRAWKSNKVKLTDGCYRYRKVPKKRRHQ